MKDHGGGEIECLLHVDPSWDWSDWFRESEPLREQILVERVTRAGVTYRRMTGDRISERRKYAVMGGDLYLSVGIWTRSGYRRYLEDAILERDGLPPKKRVRSKSKDWQRRWRPHEAGGQYS